MLIQPPLLLYHSGLWVSLYVLGLNCHLSNIRSFLGVHVVIRTYSSICSVLLKTKNEVYLKRKYLSIRLISVPEIGWFPSDTPVVTIKSFTVFESNFEIIQIFRRDAVERADGSCLMPIFARNLLVGSIRCRSLYCKVISIPCPACTFSWQSIVVSSIRISIYYFRNNIVLPFYLSFNWYSILWGRKNFVNDPVFFKAFKKQVKGWFRCDWVIIDSFGRFICL